eukprot:8789432-Pyramimonas_sp.AAC.1
MEEGEEEDDDDKARVGGRGGGRGRRRWQEELPTPDQEDRAHRLQTEEHGPHHQDVPGVEQQASQEDCSG